MTKSSKKLNIKERIDGDKMDLSLSDITEIPAKEIVCTKWFAPLPQRFANCYCFLGGLQTGQQCGSIQQSDCNYWCKCIRNGQDTFNDIHHYVISPTQPSIALLNHITVLDLSKNHITVLPAEIGKLVNLRHLDLYNNRLDHLPIEMGKLRKLRYLDVKNNPLKSGIAQIVGQCLTTQECQTAAKKVVCIIYFVFSPFLLRFKSFCTF